jgi:hypothetical protein
VVRFTASICAPSAWRSADDLEQLPIEHVQAPTQVFE